LAPGAWHSPVGELVRAAGEPQHHVKVVGMLGDTTISVSRASSLLETAFCVLRSQSHAAKACRSHFLKMEAQNFSAECAPNLTNEKQMIKSA